MPEEQKAQIDTLADKYADLILQAIDLHPDYLPDDHELFKYPFSEWGLWEIFRRGNPRYFYNAQHIIDRFREKADAIANGNLFCVDSDLKTEKQYIELWDKILYGLEKTHKELNTILTEVGLEPFYYYLCSTVKHTLDAVVFLHEVKKYIHLGDHGAPNPIPKINLKRGGKETHIQYAKAEMKKLWRKHKEKNYPPLESKLSPVGAENGAVGKTEIIPFPTPQGATWGEVYITFIDGENVRVKVKDVTKKVNYVEMGFKDKRQHGSPKKSWDVLKIFAHKEGLVTDYTTKAKAKIEKDIQEVKEDLHVYFRIDGNPIPLIGKEGYKTEFKIEGNPPFSKPENLSSYDLKDGTRPVRNDNYSNEADNQEDES